MNESKKQTGVGTAVEPASVVVPIGPRVIDLIEIAYRARRPVLLDGPTGIGKSQIVAEFARAAGLEITVLDLSLLEPPDLIGLPVIEGGRTHYASPAELPSAGRGVLMLEELNRAEIPVMQPALQLLSARRLHSYELPADWLCIAAVNPEGAEYQVNTLDPALRSRFMQISVGADPETWLKWAARANVHPVIMGMVRAQADPFEFASPRSWTYASEVLHAMRPHELLDVDLLRMALRGYLPTAWALAVAAALAEKPATADIEPELLLSAEGVSTLVKLVADLESKKRSDTIAMLAAKVRRVLASPLLPKRVESGIVTMASIESLLAPFPGDLRDQCLETATESAASSVLLASLGHDATILLADYECSPLRENLQVWRSEGKFHRVRLVVLAAIKALEAAGNDPTRLRSSAAAVTPLIDDAGHLAGDLSRWLSARGLGRQNSR